MSYQELSIEERVTIQLGKLQGFSLRAIAKMHDRSPSTVSREIRRNSPSADLYSASEARQHMRCRCKVCCPERKLVPGNELFDLVIYLLRSAQSLAARQ